MNAYKKLGLATVTAITTLLIAAWGETPAFGQATISVEDDKVGIGIELPETDLHVQVTDAGFPLPFKLENTGSDFAGFRFTTSGGSIDFNKAAGNTFRLNMVDGDSWELQLDPAGNLTIKGSIFTAGSCVAGCDRVFSPDYELPTIESHAEAMWRNRYLPTVGPTEEGQPINLSDKTERMLNELEKAHIYIDQLNTRLKQKDSRIEALEARLSRLESLAGMPD